MQDQLFSVHRAAILTSPNLAAVSVWVWHQYGHILIALEPRRRFLRDGVAGVLALDLTVLAVAPLLAASQVHRDGVVVGEVGSLVLAGTVADTDRHGRAAQWR